MKKVKIYSTPTCPYCHMAKDYFENKGIAFEDLNVADNEEKAEEMLKKSGQMGVPVIDIEGEIIVGFDREKIEKILGG
jgi:glutaredoxin-like YruB-family protein